MLTRTGMQQTPMLGLNNPPFMQGSSTGVPQQHPLGMPPGPTQPMGPILGGQPNPNPTAQRYMPQQGGMLAQNPQMLVRPGQMGQQFNPAGRGIPNQHIGPIGAGQPQPLGFSGGMMSGPAGQRVMSQSQLPQGPSHLSMARGMNNMGMAMNPQNPMAGRPPIRGPMGQDMTMGINRPNPAMSQGTPRAGTMQIMGGLGQPPPMQPGMPPSQTTFQSPLPMAQAPQMNSPPRPPSHPPSHTPSMGGQSAGMANRPQDNPMGFMGFNPQFQSGPTPQQRPPGNNPQFNFVAAGSPGNMNDVGKVMPNPANSGPRPSFPPTPAQQYSEMSQPPQSEAFPFGINANANPPPRPPSIHQHPSHTQPPNMQSPHPPEPSNPYPSHPPRPDSSAQARPPSQASQSRTPRLQPQITPITNPILPLHPSGPNAGLTAPSAPSVVPRPPQPAPIAPNGASPGASSNGSQNESRAANPQRNLSIQAPPCGLGQGLIRLMQFSGNLASEQPKKFQLSWWNELIKEYFTPKATMKFTLWKDNARNEAKPFEIGVPILPRFFLVTTQSGVKSMSLTLDGARERSGGSQGHAVIECVTAVWTYRYTSGYTVTLRGPMTVHVLVTAMHPPGGGRQEYVLKFNDFSFDANFHDKFIALDSIIGGRIPEPPKTPRSRNATTNGPNSQQDEERKWEEPRVLIEKASIPGEPVNAFGIPQATMRCLELAESVSAMADLINYSKSEELGPLEALTTFARQIRDSQPLSNAQPIMNGLGAQPNLNGAVPYSSAFHHNGVTSASTPGPTSAPSPAVTLYSSAPASVTNPSSAQATSSTMSSPQNAPTSANNSPRKSNKTIPMPAQATASTSSTASSTHLTATPPTASLKRKQQTSPTVAAAEQPPAKRPVRKKSRANNGG